MTENEHILTCLAEECAEVAKNVSKALRFGVHDIPPDQGDNNAWFIRSEMIDLLAVYEMAEERGLVPVLHRESLVFRKEMKKTRVLKWINYARTQGTITE